MFVLQLNRKIQSLIGLYRENQSDPIQKAYMLVLNFIILFGNVYILIWGSISFILANFTDLERSTNAFICLTAGWSGAACYSGLLWNQKSTVKLFANLQDIVDESKF